MEAAPLPIWATNWLPNAWGIGAVAPLPPFSTLWEITTGQYSLVAETIDIAMDVQDVGLVDYYVLKASPIQMRLSVPPSITAADELNVDAIGITSSIQNVTFSLSTEGTVDNLALGALSMALGVQDVTFTGTFLTWYPVPISSSTWSAVADQETTWTDV